MGMQRFCCKFLFTMIHYLTKLSLNFFIHFSVPTCCTKAIVDNFIVLTCCSAPLRRTWAHGSLPVPFLVPCGRNTMHTYTADIKFRETMYSTKQASGALWFIHKNVVCETTMCWMNIHCTAFKHMYTHYAFAYTIPTGVYLCRCRIRRCKCLNIANVLVHCKLLTVQVHFHIKMTADFSVELLIAQGGGVL